MFTLPERIKGITHPLIKEMYVKKVLGKNLREENVLVINASTNKSGLKEIVFQKLIDDLDVIKSKIERKTGQLDRVDIIPS